MSARSLQLNPLLATATAAQIKARRDELEQAPITVLNVGEFDADEKARARLTSVLANFAAIAVAGEVAWTLADNSTLSMDETEFTTAVEGVMSLWAIRSAELHVIAQTLVATPPTVGDLDDSSTWGGYTL